MKSNIQVIGTRKNAQTRKALRFFKERGVDVHLVDLTQRALSPGELENISQAIGTDELIDSDSAAYKKRGLAYMEFDPIEELLEHPLLMRMPVVRNGREATIGEASERWQRWIVR